MSSKPQCPICGRMRPRDSSAEVCPVCEFEGALSTSSGEVAGEPSTLGEHKRLGDYEVLEEVARGGMGVVYKARQVSLNRIVAVKMILPEEMVRPRFVRRFRAEAEAAARLQHPNIVAVYEVGEQEGRHFFSMEYVDGPNLLDLVRQKPLAPRQAAGYLQTIAEAIHYAHQRGILHRDLKPSNVLIGKSDQPKVTDFGLAKLTTTDTDLTLSGQVLGTPHYLSPEQASGKRGQLGAWTDVYGLGAILYFILTGRPPFQAQELPDVLDQVRHREPVSPRLLNPSVSRDLDTICLKCLEKEPARRYASAKALANDLGRFLRNETIVARPVSPPEKTWRWCRRKPALAAALGACALVLAAGGAGIGWQWRHAQTEGRIARRSLYNSDMLLAQQALDENNFGRVEQLLRKHDPLWSGRQTEDLRGWEWSYLRNQLRSDESFTLGSHSNTVSYLTFSSNGRWLASVSHYEFGNNIKVWDLHLRRCVATLPLQRAERLNIVAFSPDNQRLLVADENRLAVYGAPDWGKSATRLTITNRFRSLDYSADGRLLVAHESTSPFRVRVMNGQNFDTIASWPAVSGRTLAVSPDTRYVAVQHREKPEVIVYELSTGDLVTVLPGPGGRYRQGNLRFSPDGRMLASVVCSGADEIEKQVDFWSVPQFKLLQRLHPAGTYFSGVAFSPDSTLAYLASGNQTLSVCEVATWTIAGKLHGHRDEIWCVDVSPDGRWLASGSRDQTIRFWSTNISVKRPADFVLPASTTEVCLTDDGQALAAAMSNSILRVWSLTNFEAVAELPVPFHGVTSGERPQFAMTPGGTRLAMGGAPGPDENRPSACLASWELPSKHETLKLEGLRACPRGLAYSKDGKLLAAAGPFDEGQALIWDSQTGKRLYTLTNIPGGSALLKFSPRGTYIAARLDQGPVCGVEVGLWKPPGAERERLLTKPRHRVTSMAFSSDERLLATAGEDASVCIWEVSSGRRIADLKGQLNCFTAVAWSPDGDRLLGGGEDGTIILWDTTSLQPVGRLTGHRKPIRGLAFLPDGLSIVSVSLEFVRIWRALPLESFLVASPASVQASSASPAQVQFASKVTGKGVYRHFVHPRLGNVFPSDEEVGRFMAHIDPVAKGARSNDVAVSVTGPALEAFWGEPLVIIDDDFEDWIPILWDPADPKPGQVFVYRKTHPLHGEVAVCVYLHDNVTAGHNAGDPAWSDWFGVYIESWAKGNRHYNGVPDWQNDDLFTGMGILLEGDVMDHRKQASAR